MTELFGVSLVTIMVAELVLTVGVAVALVVLGLRNRVLVALALRTLPRRRTQTALIVAGLMLSTSIITSSMATGDTMSYAARDLVAQSLGRVDEVIVGDLARRNVQISPEGLSGATNGYFGSARYDALRPALLAIPGVAGVAPAIVQQASLIDRTSGQSKTSVTVLALPPGYDPAFGALLDLDGHALSLAGLGPDEVLLNREGADALQAHTGDVIDFYFRETQVARHLKTVVRNGGPGADQPVAIWPLAEMQAARYLPNQINQIDVANQGDALSGDIWSASVVAGIRSLLIDDATATQIETLVRLPDVRNAAKSLPTVSRRIGDPNLGPLFAQADRDPPGTTSLAFKTLLGNRSTMLGLGLISFGLRDRAAGDALLGAVTSAAALRVVDVKHQGLAQADVLGAAISGIFVGLGMFSIASGLMLIFLIFTLLAAERRPQMGIARAIGTQRTQLVQMFLFEGSVYDLAAGIVGVLIGLAVGLATVYIIDQALSTVDLHVRFYMSVPSLVIASCTGLLLTFVTVALSSWRVSRLNVVAAMRDLPDSAQQQRSLASRAMRGVLVWGGVTATCALAAVVLNNREPYLALQAVAISLGVLSTAMTVRHLLGSIGLSHSSLERWCLTITGLALVVFWLSPFSTLSAVDAHDLQGGSELFVVAGLAIGVGTVLVVVYNAEAVVLPLAALLGRVLPALAILRIATAYTLRQRFGTGVTLAMFALVVLTMVVAAVLNTATQRAYGDFQAAEGGFDIEAITPPISPIASMPDALQQHRGVQPAMFSAYGSLTSLSGAAIDVSTPFALWEPEIVNAADDGFLRATTLSLVARAAGYNSDAAVWQAVRTMPGLAVVDSSALPGLPGSSPDFGFSLSTDWRTAPAAQPETVWVRDSAGGAPVKLQIIGVLDARASFGTGITSSVASLGDALPFSFGHVFFFKVASGQSVPAVSQLLGLAFVDEGMQTQTLDSELTRTQGVQLLLNELVQSYVGLGLIVGLAALGVISMRTVEERHRVIGTLRALGFQRRWIQADLLLEAGFVALLGVGIGIAIGIVIAHSLVLFIGKQHPEITFGVPVMNLVVIALVATGSALLATWWPALLAARVSPAASLRHE